jgi:hypothetical protein
MNVNLHIERLVLEGFSMDRPDAKVVRDALQTELMLLFAESEIQASFFGSRTAPAVQAQPLPLESTSSPSRLGGAIAHSVYGAVIK